MPNTPADVSRKKEVLDNARQQLKEEFLGLDEVIDQVVDALDSWYLFPELQEKPLIINLWGMTGVGKTALVNRLSELIGMDDRYFRAEMGDSLHGLKSDLQKIHESSDGAPFFLSLDEFQQAKSEEDNRREREPHKLRTIWEILDSGQFALYQNLDEAAKFHRYLKLFEFLMERGLQVENGEVVQGKEMFAQNSIEGKFGMVKRGNEQLMDPNMLNDAVELLKHRFRSTTEVEEALQEMDTKGFKAFLEQLVEAGQRPHIVDCRKAVIFVIGNLDEVYKLGFDHDPEADADELHEQSKKLTVLDVKAALLKRFRKEQVARLGNTHILYPAFSCGTYEQLIQKELERIRVKVEGNCGLELSFDPSVDRFLYSEGVFPLQGTRPLFTTVQEMLDSKLGSIIAHWKLLETDCERAQLSVEKRQLVVSYKRDDETLDEKLFPLREELGKLRESRQDDKQALVAVHEAGHAVLGMLLFKEVPERVFSNTLNLAKDGNVQFSERENPLTKRELIAKGKVALGGLVAEELVFGPEDLTPGSDDDLNLATRLALKMLKDWGMGDIPGSYYCSVYHEPQHRLKDTDHELDAQAKEWVKAWKEEARGLLQEQWGLFLELAERLSLERKLEREAILELVQEVEPAFYEELQARTEGGPAFRQRLQLHVERFRKGKKNGETPFTEKAKGC